MKLYVLCDGITKEPIDAYSELYRANYNARRFAEDEGYAPLLLTFELIFDEVTGLIRFEKAQP